MKVLPPLPRPQINERKENLWEQCKNTKACTGWLRVVENRFHCCFTIYKLSTLYIYVVILNLSDVINHFLYTLHHMRNFLYVFSVDAATSRRGWLCHLWLSASASSNAVQTTRGPGSIGWQTGLQKKETRQRQAPDSNMQTTRGPGSKSLPANWGSTTLQSALFRL